ncbi:hypothetical protein PPACK8108_LOCUS13488 [Phakopsora pachyrhizi]|uniref:Uncharacterized protein n=1 Tax=Phakopsora pachyrhizi TaxID=170000 RepID=A0AAV0B4T0_PHAPC|nr:hypothetical protein PPACK8108_LOCUS13488 [Phakopsora pachyrhizi]
MLSLYLFYIVLSLILSLILSLYYNCPDLCCPCLLGWLYYTLCINKALIFKRVMTCAWGRNFLPWWQRGLLI